MDPIEKKPLYHFFPGSSILSIGPNGCNLGCDFCQNYQISQERFPTTRLYPDEAVAVAIANGSIGIAYTYTEPLIWFEYVLDTAKAAREAGLRNVLVSNGAINPEPLEEIAPWIDAANIDIKSMDPVFYRKICKGHLDPVLATASRLSGSVHLEITNLVIPGLNDSNDVLEKLCDFVADLDELTPLHFSAYHPAYSRKAPPTPLYTLERAADIASRRLKHVFIGNVVSGGNQTLCPGCGEVVVARRGYSIGAVDVIDGKCRFCGAKTGVVTGA